MLSISGLNTFTCVTACVVLSAGFITFVTICNAAVRFMPATHRYINWIFTSWNLDALLGALMYHTPIVQHSVIHTLTRLPELFAVAAVIYYIYYVIRYSIGKTTLLEHNLLLTTHALVIGGLFKNFLKVCFGRTWPLPWLGHNPSLISSHTYGFFWFHGGQAYESFPSGHMTVTASVMSVLWFGYPRLRWLWILLSAFVAIGLVGMNFHFVSDVIAGAGLGCLIGFWTYKIGMRRH